MEFNRLKLECNEDRLWLDRRMIAFKHNLMNERLLYWDIIGSRKMSKEKLLSTRNLLTKYLDNLPYRHPEGIKEFALSDNTRRYKDSFYKGKWYCILGDGLIIGIQPHCDTQLIFDELSNEVLNNSEFRMAIGYYAANSTFILPDYEMYVLDFPYFKKQMINGIVNDTCPSEEQIKEYWSKNKYSIQRMELIHKIPSKPE